MDSAIVVRGPEGCTDQQFSYSFCMTFGVYDRGKESGSFVMVFFEKESVGKQLIMDVYVFYLVWQRKQLKDFQ